VADGTAAAARTFAGIDRDLAICGALLHDIGKLDAYRVEGLAIDLSDAGKLQGEIALGYYAVRSAIDRIEGFPPALAQAVPPLLCLLTVAPPSLAQLAPPPLPQPPAAQSYYNDNGKPVGPVSLAEIRSKIAAGIIKPDTLVWKPGTPMNLGTWSIVAYSGMATYEVVRQYLQDRSDRIGSAQRGRLLKLMNNGVASDTFGLAPLAGSDAAGGVGPGGGPSGGPGGAPGGRPIGGGPGEGAGGELTLDEYVLIV